MWLRGAASHAIVGWRGLSKFPRHLTRLATGPNCPTHELAAKKPLPQRVAKAAPVLLAVFRDALVLFESVLLTETGPSFFAHVPPAHQFRLVIMLTTCMKALAWSFLFCFVIMTIWAMMIVEIVHPLVVELSAAGEAFENCEECVKSTESVMDANLLLFKTVIAGDSWGEIAVPVLLGAFTRGEL